MGCVQAHRRGHIPSAFDESEVWADLHELI